jgi:ABC-2 type transport system permease protein
MSAPRPNWHLFRVYLAETKYELLRAVRAPGVCIPSVLLPTAFYLFFGVVIIDAEELTADIEIFLLVGFSVFGVMGPGMFGFGVSVATEREHGWWSLKRALPVPPGAPLLARMIVAILLTAAMMTMLLAAALSVAQVPLTLAQGLAIAGVNVLGVLPFCTVGLLLGSLATARSAPVLVNVLYLPMVYLSGILIPLPESLHTIQLASPTFHLARLAIISTGAQSETAATVHIATLVGMMALCGLWARRRLFRVHCAGP